MRNRANPTVSKVARMPSRVDRKVMCADYEHCLNEAVKRNWQGFSCRKCQAFQPLQLNSSEWQLDSLACTVLMAVAEFPDKVKQKQHASILIRLLDIRSRGSVLGLG